MNTKMVCIVRIYARAIQHILVFITTIIIMVLLGEHNEPNVGVFFFPRSSSTHLLFSVFNANNADNNKIVMKQFDTNET